MHDADLHALFFQLPGLDHGFADDVGVVGAGQPAVAGTVNTLEGRSRPVHMQAVAADQISQPVLQLRAIACRRGKVQLDTT